MRSSKYQNATVSLIGYFTYFDNLKPCSKAQTKIHNLKAIWASQVALVVKNPPANAGGIRDEGLIPGSGRYPGEGNGTPLQYSCLENPTNKGAWWAVVCGIAKSQT